jgi:hypothetical protein
VDDFGFDDAELDDADLVPARVNDKRSYYGYYLAVMQDRIKHQAEYISRAPSRQHFVDSIRLIHKHMDDADELLALRDSRGELAGSGSIVDGLVPATGGSSIRIPSKGERQSKRRRGRQPKRPKVHDDEYTYSRTHT